MRPRSSAQRTQRLRGLEAKVYGARRHRPPPGSSVTRPQRLRVHTNLSSSNGNTLALQNRQLSIRPNTTSRTSPLCPRHKTNSRMSGILHCPVTSDEPRAGGRQPKRCPPKQIYGQRKNWLTAAPRTPPQKALGPANKKHQRSNNVKSEHVCQNR